MFLKMSSKHRQVWSCFEDLIIIKIMVQSKFNLAARFYSYNFFSFRFAYTWMMHFVYICMYGRFYFLVEELTRREKYTNGSKIEPNKPFGSKEN